MNNLRVSAVIAAAGVSKRFSPTDRKQFAELAGKPMLAYCLETMESCDLVTCAVVVAPADSISRVRKIIERFGFRKVAAVVVGGEKRSASVRNGFDAAPGDTDIVLVHDAARPFVTCGMIGSVINGCAAGYGAAVCAVSVADTLKRADTDSLSVSETVSRERLYRAQTPQAFRYSVLAGIYSSRDTDIEKPEATDEAQLAEVRGTKVKMVTGSEFNFKVTTADDLALAELIASADMWRNTCTE